MRNEKLPCETCKLRSKRCSTSCERLYNFLRWTDKNRANILSEEPVYPRKEVPFDPEELEQISNQQSVDNTHPDISIQRLFESSTDYGAIDISYLSPAEAELYRLYYCQQFTTQQIADMWGLTPNAIHMRLKRIRKKIHKHYLGQFIKSYPDTP